MQHRSGTDIIGRPQLRGDVDIYWAHLSQYRLIGLAAVVLELLLLFALLQKARMSEPGTPA
jgi:hypothetical protein